MADDLLSETRLVPRSFVSVVGSKWNQERHTYYAIFGSVV